MNSQSIFPRERFIGIGRRDRRKGQAYTRFAFFLAFFQGEWYNIIVWYAHMR